jgi:hypothetical protein
MRLQLSFLDISSTINEFGYVCQIVPCQSNPLLRTIHSALVHRMAELHMNLCYALIQAVPTRLSERILPRANHNPARDSLIWSLSVTQV